MKQQILIVDDTPTNLQLLVTFLGEAGYGIRVAEDGPSALQQVAHSKPDLILLDVMMPALNGFETCRRLKAQPETQDIPVIFMTARSEVADKLEGFEAGAVDYITKPFEKREVLARVHTHLTLQSQKRELEAMLEQRNRFMRIAAHDLRNPLTVVMGCVDLILICGPEETEKHLHAIMKAASQMQDLINNFLELQVIRAETKSARVTFDLAQVISSVLTQQTPAAKAKQIVLQAYGTDAPVMAQGHPSHAHQILTNYVTNALKFSPPATTVRISLSPSPPGPTLNLNLNLNLNPNPNPALTLSPSLRVSVTDQGPGVPPAERNRLFVEFGRISNKPTAGETSTGLGLAIVKTLAEGQGGRAGADFPEGGGSCFWFELPGC